MPSSTFTPPLLESCIHLPRDDALLLITSTLGASANWLLVRYLSDALSTSNATYGGDGAEGHNVVLVSWMREYDFWKHEARKGAGLDLDRARREARFAFVDGLSGVILDEAREGPTGSTDSKPPATGLGGNYMSSAREPSTAPARGPPGGGTVAARGTRTAAASTRTPVQQTLTSLDLRHLESTIIAAITQLTSTSPPPPTQRKTLLMLDNPDLFLAMNPAITPSALTALVLTLHTLPTISHILTHVQADTPLLSLSTPAQPLQLEHHNLLVKLAHMSSRVVGLRVLDTGVARDVSGVLRVTEHKTGWLNLGFNGGVEGEEETVKGREFLYQVKGDGSVKVFERGASGDD
ncbi:hypothetical protein T440DRAFT_550303 [Plenodomus tracheiphilus IPT5]|uniref:Elongator complex protein 6 n=1 Tax=Plenodomus tracheiphilus IPT5 TaxID=1408161 RepID=A0A6A7BQF9_9PLEO|nr:hypothetical protein T440DRAFT_550303 [Plenodomus tracheiphilus IPT5]